MTITNCLYSSEKPQDISDLALSHSLSPTRKEKIKNKQTKKNREGNQHVNCKYFLSSLGKMNQTILFYPLAKQWNMVVLPEILLLPLC